MAKTLTTEQKTAAGIALVNEVRSASPASYQAAVPVATIANWQAVSGSIIDGGFTNMFYAGLHNYVYNNILYAQTFKNWLSVLKKGRVRDGNGVRELAADLTDVLPYTLTDTEREELQRKTTELYEQVYTVNVARRYKSTIGPVQYRQILESPESVYNATDALMQSVYTSAEWDEMVLTITLIQQQIVEGKWKTVKVDMSDSKNALAKFQSLALDLREPRRDWNAYGIPRSTPLDRQYLIMTNERLSQFGVKDLAYAFHKDEAQIMQRVLSVSSLSKPFDGERIKQLQAVNPDIPMLTAAQTALLDKVVAILIDERVVQIWDYIFEMWDKPLASTMETNYQLHDWQIFAISMLHNAIVIVDDTADIAEPASLTATVTGKYKDKSGNCKYTVEFKHDVPSFVGGNAKLIESNELAADGIRVFRSGEVDVPQSASGAALKAELSGTVNTTYTATENIDTATEVGAEFTMNKDV